MKLHSYIAVNKSSPLRGTVALSGAKNAILPILASLLLTRGVSVLSNVPVLYDVIHMCVILESLGARIHFDTYSKVLTVDTTAVEKSEIPLSLMKEIRASILLVGSLLAQFKHVKAGFPGGDNIGARPIDFHLRGFVALGAQYEVEGSLISIQAQQLRGNKIVLEYPSVGATENILMAAVKAEGITRIINAALEPEVMDLIGILQAMGAHITIQAPATIVVEGVKELNPVSYTIMPDRLEAGALLFATAIAGGSITISDAPVDALDVVLHAMACMGHTVEIGDNNNGVTLYATDKPQAISLRTMPYPGFPTDLQAPLVAALCYAQGTSVIEETVFENRFHHIAELQKMGAHITLSHNKAIITGPSVLHAVPVEGTDIRAVCSLLLAGLGAVGTTYVHGVHHFKRGFDSLERKLVQLGGSVEIITTEPVSRPAHSFATAQVV